MGAEMGKEGSCVLLRGCWSGEAGRGPTRTGEGGAVRSEELGGGIWLSLVPRKKKKKKKSRKKKKLGHLEV